ncbi:MAG TPA: peptidylprolyl isomerase [Planctomycetota bacterium]|nr:peptidylprolyl isomerase [Planctomycetota bacterium]
MKTALGRVCACALSATALFAQQLPPTPAPVAPAGVPPTQAPTASRPSKPPAPLKFSVKLPETPAAKIDGEPITQAEFLEFVLKGNFSQVGQALIMAKIIEDELASRGLKVEDKDVDAECAAIINRIAPGRTLDEVVKSGAYSRAELVRQGWLQRATDLIFLEDLKKSGGQAAPKEEATAMMIKKLTLQRLREKYDIKMRGMHDLPSGDVVAELVRRSDGKRLVVTADESLEMLLGLVKPASMADALSELIDARLATREAKKAGREVTDAEVDDWAWSQMAKYTPPFDWATICSFKRTSTEAERERWRRIQCWKRATSAAPTEAQYDAYLAENRDYFIGKNKNVSHILLMTKDPVTGMEKPQEEQEKAKKQAETLLEKAREGADFAFLARTYSDDPSTAPSGGAMGQPIKKMGGGLDPEFQKAAWALETGDLGIAKSSFGWHVIKCDKVTPGKEGVDYTKPEYREFVYDEYDTERMKAWLQEVRAKTKVERQSIEELWKLKDLKFQP